MSIIIIIIIIIIMSMVMNMIRHDTCNMLTKLYGKGYELRQHNVVIFMKLEYYITVHNTYHLHDKTDCAQVF